MHYKKQAFFQNKKFQFVNTEIIKALKFSESF